MNKDMMEEKLANNEVQRGCIGVEQANNEVRWACNERKPADNEEKQANNEEKRACNEVKQPNNEVRWACNERKQEEKPPNIEVKQANNEVRWACNERKQEEKQPNNEVRWACNERKQEEKPPNIGVKQANNEGKRPCYKVDCTCPKEEKHPHFRPEVQPLEKEKVPGEQVTVERTSDFYRIDNIPGRFEFPCSFQGYGTPQQQNPMYRTTSAEYGAKPPSVHTVPVSFHPRPQKFTNHLGPCGMYRNRSLNTALDKSII